MISNKEYPWRALVQVGSVYHKLLFKTREEAEKVRTEWFDFINNRATTNVLIITFTGCHNISFRIDLIYSITIEKNEMTDIEKLMSTQQKALEQQTEDEKWKECDD